MIKAQPDVENDVLRGSASGVPTSRMKGHLEKTVAHRPCNGLGRSQRCTVRSDIKYDRAGGRKVYKRELRALKDVGEGDSLKGWANKMQDMLKTMIVVAEAEHPTTVKKIDMKFLNLFEKQDGGPPKEDVMGREYFEKQLKMSQKELSYVRN